MGRLGQSATTCSDYEGRARRHAPILAADRAEHIIHYFEQKHPKDVRPLSSIAATCAWVRGKADEGEARTAAFVAHEIAREADDSAAIAEARSAGQAVVTAHMFGHAIHAFTYAIKSVAFSTNVDAIAVVKERT